MVGLEHHAGGHFPFALHQPQRRIHTDLAGHQAGKGRRACAGVLPFLIYHLRNAVGKFRGLHPVQHHFPHAKAEVIAEPVAARLRADQLCQQIQIVKADLDLVAAVLVDDLIAVLLRLPAGLEVSVHGGLCHHVQIIGGHVQFQRHGAAIEQVKDAACRFLRLRPGGLLRTGVLCPDSLGFGLLRHGLHRQGVNQQQRGQQGQ